MEIAGKVVSKEINPFELNFLRFLIGALILLPLAIKDLRRRKIYLNRNDVTYFFISGFLCVFVSMSFFQLAIVYTKASTVAIVFSTNPVFTIPFAYFLLKEQLNRKTIFSLLISLLGLICILNPFNIHSDINGIVLAILAAITFSFYSVIGKMRSDRYGSIVMNCFTFLAGDIIMLFIMLISHIQYIAKLNEKVGLSLLSNIPIIYGINQNNIFTLMYMGIVVTGLGYLFYFYAMEETSATTSSIVFFIKPALAPILSLMILHESISNNTIVGILFILMGSYITFVGRSSRGNTGITEIKNIRI
jgi:Permeases of the drug/metabolite transporter (DMT) superfamily